MRAGLAKLSTLVRHSLTGGRPLSTARDFESAIDKLIPAFGVHFF